MRMFFLRRVRRSWLSLWQFRPLTLSTTKSRTALKVSGRAAIAICSMCLVMVGSGQWAVVSGQCSVASDNRPRTTDRLHTYQDARRHGAGHRDPLDVVPLDARGVRGADHL